MPSSAITSSEISRCTDRVCVTVGLVAILAAATEAGDVRCGPLQLDVAGVEGPPSQYTAFCAEEPAACDLAGDPVLDWAAARLRLQAVNAAVNAEIAFVPDEPGEGGEERWRFPAGGTGDCEDFALEKRRRLVAEGVASAALTMAIVHHQTQFFPHAVLLAETTRGTWVLDNLYDEIACWDAVPYRYERRELPDGAWERYRIR